MVRLLARYLGEVEITTSWLGGLLPAAVQDMRPSAFFGIPPLGGYSTHGWFLRHP